MGVEQAERVEQMGVEQDQVQECQKDTDSELTDEYATEEFNILNSIYSSKSNDYLSDECDEFQSMSDNLMNIFMYSRE